MKLPMTAFRKTALVTFGLILTVSATQSFANSDCKGLEQAQCEQQDQCLWVKGYTRKDGKEVSGYCRTTAKQSQKSDKSTKSDTESSAKTTKPASSKAQDSTQQGSEDGAKTSAK